MRIVLDVTTVNKSIIKTTLRPTSLITTVVAYSPWFNFFWFWAMNFKFIGNTSICIVLINLLDIISFDDLFAYCGWINDRCTFSITIDASSLWSTPFNSINYSLILNVILDQIFAWSRRVLFGLNWLFFILHFAN